MNTLKEIANKYAESYYPRGKTPHDAYSGARNGFMAGYNAAFEWIDVEDRLPDTDRAILAMNQETKTVWTSNMDEGKIYPLGAKSLFGVITEATHWREIEIPE